MSELVKRGGWLFGAGAFRENLGQVVGVRDNRNSEKLESVTLEQSTRLPWQLVSLPAVPLSPF